MAIGAHRFGTGDFRLHDALDILDLASSASSPRELCRGVTELVTRRLGARQAVMGIQNRLEPSPGFLMFNGEHSFAEKYVDYYHDQDPYDITQYLRGNQELHSFSRFLARKSTCECVDYADIMHSEYYVDFCRPQKVHYSLAVRLDGGPSLRAYLCIHRGRDDDPFPRATVEMMETLSPHLSVNLKRTVDEQVVSAIDGDDEVGLLILDGNAQVLYSNAVAEGLLRALGSGETGSDRATAEMLSSLTNGGGHTTIETGEGPYLVDARIMYSPDSGETRIIKIRRTLDFHSLYRDILHARFGFSERETEVLVAVIRGSRNKEIARQLFVSEHTVKKHIQSMARKAGVSSRTALVHAALRELNLIP